MKPLWLDWVRSVLVFASLVVLIEWMGTGTNSTNGIPVLLSHRCTGREAMNLGDRRDVTLRLGLDHSSLVNERLLRTETDLRREIVTEMATRREQVVYFSGDERLSYGEVMQALSDLKDDDPSMFMVLLTRTQALGAEPVCLRSVD